MRANSGNPTTDGGDRAQETQCAGAVSPCLVTIYGPKLGERIGLDAPDVVLGRSSESAITIPLSDISRRHCRFRCTPEQVRLEDLASTNGTFVNGEELRDGRDVVLRSRDLVKVGGAIFRFLCGADVDELYKEEIHRVAIVDGLTQIYNERYLHEFLQREIARSRRHERPLSLLLFDVDDLGEINESFGRLAGDAVLRDLAARVKGRIRAESCFARVESDEFAIVLPELGLDEAQLFARIVAELVSGTAFEFQGTRFAVTVSTGASTLETPDPSVAELLAEARERLALARQADDAGQVTREVPPPR